MAPDSRTTSSSEIRGTAPARPTGSNSSSGPSTTSHPSWNVGKSLAYIAIGLVATFCMIPFAWIILTSFDDDAGLYLQWPSFSLSNFARVFQDPTILRMVVNSLFITLTATAIAVVLSLFGGYAFSRFRFFGRRTLLFGILLVRVVPPLATIVPLYMMMITLGLNDSYAGIILVETAYQLPLTLWLMKGFFDSIPAELEEAAWMDGCSRISGAVWIIFPLSRPGIGACTLFAFIDIWGEFLIPLVLLQDPDLYPLSIGMFRAFSERNLVDWGLLTGMAVIYMVPTVILYLIARRHLLKASMGGALKG